MIARPARRGESRRTRHQGGRALPARRSPAGGAATVRLRLRAEPMRPGRSTDFDEVFAAAHRTRPTSSTPSCRHEHRRPDARARPAPGVRRHDLEQAVLLLRRARSGSTAIPTQPPPPAGPQHGRNSEWAHLNNADIISMPDKWEYPWYAAWDLAFHCIPLALIDPEFAKQQLVLLTREWYMHPNGQLPAYEWAFGDVNPPVHAWATWRVFQIDRKQRGDERRPRVPRARLPQADAELHLVGEPQGRRGPQHLPGRLPRARQHRRLRPQRAAADRRLHQPGRRHRAGWRCTA